MYDVSTPGACDGGIDGALVPPLATGNTLARSKLTAATVLTAGTSLTLLSLNKERYTYRRVQKFTKRNDKSIIIKKAIQAKQRTNN